MKTNIKLLSMLLCLFAIAWACKKPEEKTPVTPSPTPNNTAKSPAKDITKFSFAALNPAVDATIDATAKTITATAPAATDITKLVPTITVSDKATISPATGVAQDFSKEVSYTVTAEDGGTMVWKVVVKKEVVATVGSTVNSENVIYLLKSSYDFIVPAKGNNSAYLGQTHRIVAIDPNNGNELAIFPNTDKGFFPFPLFYENGSLVVGGYYPDDQSKRKNEVLDATNGKIKSSLTTNNRSLYQTDIVENSIIYHTANTINNVDAATADELLTGKKLWEKTLMGKYPVYANGLIYTLNIYADGINRGIHCSDAKTGEQKWVGNGGGTWVAEINPVVSDGLVFYARAPKEGGNINRIVALDAINGKLVWESVVDISTGNKIDASPTIANSVLYFQATKQIFALDAKTGVKKWSKSLTDGINNNGNTNNSSVTYGNNMIFIKSADDYIIALDAETGNQKWVSNKLKNGINNIIYANGTLYTGTSAIEATSGAIKWELKNNPVPFSTTDITKYYGYSAYYGHVVVLKNKAYYPSLSGMQQ
jgi:eukaryotic-like serine/threonine-protein kinase